MCRFLVYKGSDEILLSKLILDPTHSILKQSFDSRLRLDTRRGQNNADGFGIGFYTDPKLGSAPCLFTSTTPAWNCTNLQRIASKTASPLIFAHVRATTEGTLSEDNCHPFCHGSLMWMHNGGLGGWRYIKRRLGERLADRWYLGVVGGTDSEWSFALFLDTLERMGFDPSAPPPGRQGFGPTVLRRAMLATIRQINDLIDQIPESVVHSENVDTRSLLNFAVTDGHSVICTRYVSSATDEAASLYYSSGSQWENRPSPGDDHNYQMERRDKGADVVLVASEPLTFERENWVNVPTNSILTIHNQTVMVHPIVDQYYTSNPNYVRSAAFARAKGLSVNEKSSLSTRVASPLPTPQASEPAREPVAALAATRRNLAPTIPLGMMRTRTSESAVTTIPDSLRNLTPSSVPEPLTTPDLRSVTAPPPLGNNRQPIQEQGNIKKKRKSLSQLEDFPPGPSTTGGGGGASSAPAPEEHEPATRTEYGNPNKIAQFFPELTLSQ